ncbi:hypothetical protein SAMN02982996_00064 [Lonsdalea quercina]|uniref:Uncharacterized protein n=1 Tax=Lonsdalea quercina TaxID=71657 RepID=A0A1H3VKI7_9GAMM|nr:hypothetical protein SAMN02982996_00064 [Lonsdalea quercina]
MLWYETCPRKSFRTVSRVDQRNNFKVFIIDFFPSFQRGFSIFCEPAMRRIITDEIKFQTFKGSLCGKRCHRPDENMVWHAADERVREYRNIFSLKLEFTGDSRPTG